VNTTPSSPSLLARRRSRAHVDHLTAPQHPHAPIKGGLPSTIPAHHHDHHSPPPRSAPVATSIVAGARPIDASLPRKLCSNRRRSRPPQATPLLQAASPSSTTSPSTLTNPSWSHGEPPTPYRRRASDLISPETTTALCRSISF
jgi:hypothetical protein